MQQMINKIIKNEEGSGLVLSLMVLLVLSVLGASLGVLTVGSYQLADYTHDSNSAYYIAESGANMAYEEIESKIEKTYEDSITAGDFFDEVTGLSSDSYDNFSQQFDDNPKATITVEGPNGEGDEREYIIKSSGEINGKKRVVKKLVEVYWIEKQNSQLPSIPLGTAITFKAKLDMSSNSEVHGDIRHDGKGTTSLSSNAKHYPINNNQIISDNSIVWEDYNNFVNNFPEKRETEKKKLTNPLVPKGNIYIPIIDLSSSNTLILDTNNSDVYIEVDELDLSSNSELIIRGNGKVIIYVNEEISLSSNSKINENSKTGQLSIFYAGRNKVKFSSNSELYGSLFVKNADIEFSSNFEMPGYIITGGKLVDISSNANVKSIIIAPLATLDMSSNSSINGAVIANTVDMSSNSNIQYSSERLEIPGNGESIEVNQSDLISTKPAKESDN